VLDIGSSRELCGGTHVKRTGDIGFFKVISEGGVAAGVRRIEATTGEGALKWAHETENQLNEIAFRFGFESAHGQQLADKVEQLRAKLASTEKELSRFKSKLAASQGDELVDSAVDVKGIKVLAATLDGADARALRETLDKLKDRLKTAAIVLAAVNDGKVALIAGVTPDLTAKVKAGELINYVAQQVGGKGGGRADMAQAGGTSPEKLPAALASVKSWVEQKL
jgi:alanyl-tRNA synthetase